MGNMMTYHLDHLLDVILYEDIASNQKPAGADADPTCEPIEGFNPVVTASLKACAMDAAMIRTSPACIIR